MLVCSYCLELSAHMVIEDDNCAREDDSRNHQARTAGGIEVSA